MGILTNVLNPKATLFFLGLFTMVLTPNTPHTMIAIMGIMMIFDTIVWFSCVAIFFTQARIRSVFERFQGVFNKIFGGLLIALGIKIAIMQK